MSGDFVNADSVRFQRGKPFPVAGGKWYANLGGRNVELRPEVNGDRVSWYFANAGGIGLGQVREDELRWTSGDIPE